MLNIGIDLDGVLTDSWHENVLTECIIEGSVGMNMDFRTFWTQEWLFFPKMRQSFFIHNSPLYFRMAIDERNIKFLKDISQRHTIYYITSRPKSVQLDTEIWMKKQDLPCKENLYFASEEQSKADICKNLGIDLMVEDSVVFAQEIRKVIPEVCLRKRPWNSDAVDFNRVSRLFEIGELYGL